MSSITLPTEVIERVIDCCHDNSYTLRQLTLTCRLLLPRSRHHLFAFICIKGADVTTLYLFYDTLAARPWLRLLIRSVKIVARDGVAFKFNDDSDSDTEGDSRPTLLDIIPATLLTLPRLTQWSLVRDYSSLTTLTAKPASFTPRTLASYGKCGSRIRVLCLQDVEYLTGDDFWHFISAFPCLRSLRCQGIMITQPGVLRTLSQIGYRQPRKLKLDNLEVAGVQADDAITVLLEACSCLPSLESLSLDVNQAERFIAFISQLPGLGRLTLEFELRVEGMIVRSIRQLVNVLKLFQELPISGSAFQFSLRMPVTFPSRLNQQLTVGDAPVLCKALEEQLLCVPHLRHVIFHFRGLRANRHRFWMVELSQHFPQLHQRGLFDVRADAITAIGHDNTTPRYRDEDTHATVFRSVVSATAVSRDNEWMASGSTDTTIIVWCLKERRGAHQWVAHTAAVDCLAFSPDGQKLMSGGRLDSSITIWDVSLPQGAQKIVALNCAGSSPAACAWSPALSDRESLVACVFSRPNCNICVWDVHTLQLRYTFRLSGAAVIRCFVTFSPDGRWLATEGGHGSCHVRDSTTGTLHTVLQDPVLSIHTAVFDPSSKRIATTSGKGSTVIVQLWDVEAGTRLLSFPGNGLYGVPGDLKVSFSPDDLTVLSMGDRPTIWDAATGEAIRILHVPGGMDHSIVCCLCFSPDGRYVAATSYFDGVMPLWRVRDGACIATLSGHYPSIPHHVGFSAEAQSVFFACDDGTVYMYQLSDIARSPDY